MPRLKRLPFVLLTVTVLLFSQYEKVIAQAPTAEFEANDTIVCVGNVISFTDLSIPGGSAITDWDWEFGDGGTSTQQNPTYSYSVGGNYTVQLIVTDALNNKDTITHTIYVLVAQAVQNTIRICSPQTTATIIAEDPNITGVTGTWFSASGAIIASPGNDTTLISNLISGTYVFFWVVSDGVCSDADQVTVFVDQPIAANANVDQQICTVPGTTNLAGNNPSPGSGIWTTTSTATIANPSNRNTAVSGLTTPGTYTFVWTITNGACTNRDTMRITVTAPIAANAGVDQTVCASTATLAATNPTPGTGVWTTTGAASIATPSSINSSVSGLIVGNNTFIWSVSNGACITRDTVIIVVSQLINSNAGANITICTSSGTATLNGNNPTPGTGLWTALNGGSITTPASATSTVTGLITAGTYNFVWTITNGACVSRDTVAVIVNSPVVANAGADQNICNIRVATLTGNAPAPGTGSWSTTGSATIASPASATTGVSNLAIGNNTFVYTITLGTCISRDTIIVRVDSLITANAGPDQQICETTTTITLAGNTATPGTGTWTSLNGGTITTPASPTSTVTGLTPGQHQFVWTITNGTCTSRDTMRVTVNVQIPANAGLDQQICQGSTTSISGNNPTPATGLWTTTSSATIVSPSSATSAVNGFGTPGIYNFIWTVTNGACVQRDTVRITVNAIVNSNAGPDQSICNATTATLAGNSATPGSGVWTSIGSASVTTPSSATSGVTGLTTGNNQFVWTITNGACITRDTVNIRVDILVASNAGVNQSVCLGAAVTLTGNAPTPGTGLWTALNGGTITTPASATTNVTGISVAGSYNFVWTITNGTCVSRDTVQITVSNQIAADAGADTSYCALTSILLDATDVTPAIGTWTALSGGQILDVNDPNTIVNNLNEGFYQFVWEVANGACITRDTVSITIDTLFVADAGVDQQICQGDIITLNGSAPLFGSVLWTALNGGTIVDPGNTITQVTDLNNAGTYSFVWTITNGSCTSTDTVDVIVDSLIIADAGKDQELCEIFDTNLEAEPAALGIGTWSTNGTGIIDDVNDPLSLVSGLSYGDNEFIWTVENNNCSSTDIVIIHVDSLIVADAGIDQQICSTTSQVTLAGNIAGAGTGQWLSADGFTFTDANDPNTTVTGFTNAGTYFIEWEITNGACVSLDTLVLIVDSNEIANAGADQTLCELFDATLSADAATIGIGTWSTNGSAIINDINDPNTTLTSLSYGDNEFVWTIVNNSCETSDTIIIHVDSLIVADAGIDQQICSTTSQVTLSANSAGAGTGQWFSADGFTFGDVNDPNTTVTGFTNAGTYFIEWEITNGLCSSLDTLVLIVDSNEVANAGADQSLCELFDATLSADAATIGIGTWSTNGSAIINDINDPNTTLTSLSYGDNEFVWTIVNNSCETSDTIIIHVDSLIVADAGIDQQICSTTSQVTLSANSAGTGTGQWFSADGFTFADVNDPNTTVTGFVNAGTYFIELEITNGLCTSLDTLVLIVDSNEVANAGADQSLCDLFDATLSADAATIGIGTWSTNGSAIINDINDPNTTLTSLSYGDNEFVWTIVNNSCETSDTIIIHVDSLIVAHAGIDQQICSTTSQVTLSANSAGAGTGQWFSADGFTFADVNDPNTTVTGFVNAGTYFIEWEITNGLCTSLDTLVLIVDSNEVANAGADQSLCDLFDATLSADAATIGIGTWSTTGSTIINDINDPNTTLTSLSYGDNEFVWTIVNNSCETSDTIIIHVDSLIVADSGIDQQICSTTSQVTLSANSAGAGTGQWFSADGFTFADVNDPNTTVTGFVNAGTYFIEWEITNGVCTSLDTLVLIVDSNVVADAGTDQALCETQDSTSLNATAVTVGTGNWSSTSSSLITDVTDPNTSVTGLTVGTHDFIWTVTNNSCVSIDTVTVIVSALASPAFAGLPQQACASNNSVALAANAPSVGVGQWSTLTGATITDVNDPNTTVSNLTIGLNIFVWTVTNGACSSTDTTYVGVTPNPIADAGIDQFVTNGVSVVIGGTPSGSGGIPPLVFSWSPATFLDDSLLANPTATVTNTQQYILTVADSFGCVGSDTMVVYLNNPPIANTDSLVIDEDSTVVIAILDNDTDLDSNIDSTSIQVSINPTSGSVTISTTTGTITYVPNPNFFGSDSLQYVICDTGLPVYCDTAWVYITVNPVNDAPIAVDDSVTTVEDSCIQIIVLANDSDVENGIVVSSLGTLTSPNNGTITLDTLTGVYTYCPDTNFIGIDTLVYIICDNGTPALCDTAVVIITVNSKNDAPIAADDNVTLCSSDSVVIDVLANDIEPDNDTLSISIIQIPLNGNAYIDTNLTIVYQPTISVNGLDSIQYVVCDNQTPSLCDTAWAYIFINATPNIVLTTSDSKCFGDSVGSITSVVTGNSPFVYSWSNADTLSSIDSLVAGIYTLMVMDSLGCTATATDTVIGPANALAATFSLQNVLCFGDSTGAIDLQINGGTSPYTYSWSTADTTEDIDSLPIGIYTVTILDSNLCQLIVVDSISQPDSALVATLTVTDILCGGDSTGSATVVVNGGTPGYTYAWSTSDTISNLSNLYSGIYSVTITDAFSCAVVLTDTINDLNTPLVSTINTINPQCLAGVQGQINLQISGGVLPYIYNWNNGDSTAVLDSLSSGLYTVTVIDSNNCQVIDSVSLADSSVYVLSTTDSVLCQGDSTVLFATGYADLVYNWYADGVLLPDTIAGIIVSQTGSYNVTSTNVCGVYSSDTINVIVNTLPIATITGPNATVCDSAIVLSGSGGNSYSWNPAQACTTPDQPSTSILLANSTTVILNIVDTNGCTSSDSLFVTVTCDSLNIPSGFSPNGDGVNDYFYIENIERYPNAVLKVFNRWGNLVYEKKNYDNSWNGDSNSKIITIGEVLTNGTYFYVLDLANDEDPIQGYIILRR